MTPNTMIDAKPVSEEPLSIGDRFRANVKRMMCEQNLSQAALADRLTALGEFTNSDNVRQLLKSTSFPSTKWIELLARSFGCDEVELIRENFTELLDR